MTSLVLTSVWQFFPFVVVTYLARLQTIPPELYEAARVDGASAWRRFLHVTLPQTAAVLFVIVLLRSIWMFTKFDTVWLLAGESGVGRYIRTLPVYAYARSFTYLQAGMGAALAVIMFVMLSRRPRCTSGPSAPKRRWREAPRALYAAGLVLLVAGAFPFFWMLSTALKPSAEIFATPPALIPLRPTLDNFRRLFVETNFLTFFRTAWWWRAPPSASR